MCGKDFYQVFCHINQKNSNFLKIPPNITAENVLIVKGYKKTFLQISEKYLKFFQK